VAGLLGLASQDTDAAGNQGRAQTCPYRSQRRIETILNPQAGVAARAEAIHGFDDDLRPAEIDALAGFLKSHETEEDVSALHYLKNEVLNKLRSQTIAPKGLTETMIAMYHDRQQDETTRDYAVQHMAAWYEDGAEDAQDAKARIREALVQAAREKTVLGSTALLNLHELSHGDPSSFDAKAIDKLALEMAAASDTPVAARVTAFQVCAERQVAAAAPAIDFAVSNSGESILRTSAISAIGALREIPQAVAMGKSQPQEQVSLDSLALKQAETTRTSTAQ